MTNSNDMEANWIKKFVNTAAAVVLIGLQSSSYAQGTAFTYQGRLTADAAPANGIYDLRFTVYDAASDGNAVAGPVTNAATGVSNGLFTVTLDFGDGVFTGANRWLEISVSTNNAGDFSTLSPRQALTPTPYAIAASRLTGPIQSDAIGGTYSNAVTFNNNANIFAGDGTSISNVNAATLGGLDNSNFWKTTGNSDTSAGANFIGTTDNQPLEFKVNGLRALRLEPTPSRRPNIIGGTAVNHVGEGVFGATIAGGGDARYQNEVLGIFGTVSGGSGNSSSGFWATIGGGFQNTSSGQAATVPGGSDNMAAGDYSFAAGLHARATNQGAFVWADSQDSEFTSTSDNEFSIRASGGVRLNSDTSLFWGTGAQLRTDQGGAIELGDSKSATATPYINFHYGKGADENYNVRLINDADGQLTVNGNLNVTGSITPPSDRNVKAGFEPVDTKAILEKVTALAITRWHYTNDATTPHLGPVAQDFHAAFDLGGDDKHIATVDADGVALAAIQGLNRKLAEKEAELQSLKRRLADLEAVVSKLTKNSE